MIYYYHESMLSVCCLFFVVMTIWKPMALGSHDFATVANHKVDVFVR